jgi:hypothetical protein
MADRKVRFRQIDMTRALRAAKAAGIGVERVEIDPASGKIVVIAKGEGSAEPTKPLDEWRAANARAPQRAQ